ncbi:cytochrome P450 [Nemania sp. FL0031]|nr:cytochrome P450 [Nemania sp. FL0031]
MLGCYILCTILLSFILMIAGVFWYRALFHPLSSYPGPKLAAISNAYAVYHACKGDLHLQTLNAHLKNGTVIRQGPNKLVFNSLQALRDIYQNTMVTKSESYLVSQPFKGTFSIFNTIDPARHASKRKIVAHALSPSLMHHLEPAIAEQVDILIGKLHVHCRNLQNPPLVNIAEICQRLALDIVGLVTFGYHFNLQSQDTHLSFRLAVKLHSFLFNVFLQQPVLKQIISPFLSLVNLFGFEDPFLRTINHIVSYRQKDDRNGKYDFYSVSANSVDSKDMISEGGLLVLAGGETVSTGLSALFFYLSSNPYCYRKVAQEIRSTFPCVTEIHRGKKLSSCQYLMACIQEALRMSPPISGTLWRRQVQGGGKPVVIDGHVIPNGVEFGVNTYAFHHNEDIFPDPFCFNPDRWIADDRYKEINVQRRAFSVFSTGVRGCPGKSVAYLEISLVMAKTLWYFDFEAIPGGRVGNISGVNHQPQFKIWDRYTSTYEGPFLHFSLREN